MTKTALRALIVSALSAAVLATAAPAVQAQELCDPPSGQMTGCPVIPCPEQTDLVHSADGTPRCKPWAEDKGDPESDPQRPSLDPDPSWTEDTNITVCMVQPWLCEPDAVSTAPEPSAPSAPVASPAPSAPSAQADPIAPEHETAAQPAAAQVPGIPVWVLQDKVVEFLKALFPWAFLRV
jgi:hypothetical protein